MLNEVTDDVSLAKLPYCGCCDFLQYFNRRKYQTRHICDTIYDEIWREDILNFPSLCDNIYGLTYLTDEIFLISLTKH